jgi:hypothetical protein
MIDLLAWRLAALDSHFGHKAFAFQPWEHIA